MKLLDRLTNWATKRNIFILLVIFIAFNTLVWPYVVARIEAQSGGVGPLDVMFSYSPAEAYEMIEAYGAEGRQFYTIVEITADLVYPLSTSLLFGLLLAYIYRRTFPGNKVIRKLILFPIVPLVTDYAENLGVVIMLASYPEQLPAVARVASFMTSAKWISVGVTVAIVVVGFAALLVKKIASLRGRKKT
ncbi:hypothetical protein NC796_25610 [Aliifodinibius sp. S!AR15-10]|uniref:hypothetical protein n=1 Tax=Aliifodinibius sp. S!AR15-10 TaxID=2950437 RepID=UPI00285F5E24|nr:hypothetical protein [Aliifodinibius sp. S!AR15-10]MDR8394548.1 hypothetical protein [Aliifodinibius sp. S!AR15-10]